jgi:murein DD-endopeptidase MepM/ murein hydrolase activator NlpD
MATRIALLLTLLAALLVPFPAAAADTDPVGVWPLVPEPEVVAGFDPPDSPWGAGHRGVDLLGAVGQPVRAALPGRVSWAGVLAGRGVVVVDHGATRTTYEPVDATVAVGDRVAAGDRIGRLAFAGSHCLPRSCLHWGWIEGETYLDPLRLVGAGPVRLLPLWRDEPLPYADWRPMVSLRPLSPWVSLLVGPPQPVGGDVRVELGGRQ